MKPIFTGLSPNAEKDDVALAFRFLFQPWKWKKGCARERLEAEMKRILGVRHAFAFESGRTSLMFALQTLDLQNNAEVLLQAFTCVAVPNAVRWARGKPITVDTDAQSLSCMDPDDLEKNITSRSRAVIVQHTFGNPGELSKLQEIAKRHNLFVIEDCAHTIGGEYAGRQLGTFGDMAIFSFGRDKAISSVFGGMLVTNDDSAAKKIRTISDAAPFPSDGWIAKQLLHPLICAAVIATFSVGLGKLILFFLKKIGLLSLAVLPEERHGERPSFVGKKMPNALCELALHQLSKLDRYNAHRCTLAKRYSAVLAKSFKLQASSFKTGAIPLRFPLFVDNQNALLAAAKRVGIYLGDWYRQPIAPSGVDYDRIGYTPGSCPNAELAAKHIVNLPLDIHITPSDVNRINTCLNDFERSKDRT